MAYSADSFSAGEQPTTAKWNKLWANDASFNDGTGIANDAVTDTKLVNGKVFRRQGGNATNWAVAGTTTYDVSATDTKIQCGIIGSGSGADVTVTFPSAFSQKPVVVVSTVGGNAGGDTALSQNAFAEVVGDVSTTSFSVRTFNTSGTQSNQAVSWIAIGV